MEKIQEARLNAGFLYLSNFILKYFCELLEACFFDMFED